MTSRQSLNQKQKQSLEARLCGNHARSGGGLRPAGATLLPLSPIARPRMAGQSKCPGISDSLEGAPIPLPPLTGAVPPMPPTTATVPRSSKANACLPLARRAQRLLGAVLGKAPRN